MPELPEVETIARTLRPSLEGRRILSTRLLWQRSLAAPAPEAFEARIGEQEIIAVGRRAKYLHVRLSGGHLFIHLRMSGDLWIKPAAEPPATHDRLHLVLDDGQALVFNDPRKFGRVWLVENPLDVTGDLGPEPFSDDFTPAWLYGALTARRRQLKPLLLDQSFLAGLGNIYTDESLHRAKLHPLALSDSVTEDQAARLFHAIRAVLETGIAHNGASIDWVYRGGGFQNYFNAYGRDGQPCPACGTIIEKIIVGQRGTHFCSNCQPRK